ncbi:MAG: GTP-binding protein [Candidatus Aminicenantes bacterium]|nr:GTP-binding protein [Candidatus Aminicenantes bacterium]
MAHDMEIIRKIEKLTGGKLKPRPLEGIWGIENGYALDKTGQVQGVNLDNREIKDISFLRSLSGLTHLYLSSNQITDLMPLMALSNLTELYLSNNQIADLTPLRELKHLTTLDVHKNLIRELSPDFTSLWPGMAMEWKDDLSFYSLNLYGNPLEKPPLEIIKQGKTAIKAYFDSLKEDTLPLNEVKVLLVGDGAAGKTSLVNRLLGLDFNIGEPQTHGINIKPWTVKQDGKTIKAHLWDFGGQEIMHATHQFFLSKRSLYLLVLDGRKDEKTEYWLKHIESFGGHSPVLVVINKTDANPGFELNRKFLQDKYPNLKSFYRVSCKNNEGFDTLVPALEKELAELAKVEDGLDGLTMKAKEKELAKPLNKLGRLLEKMGDKDSKFSKILEGTKKGVELAQKVGRTYNKFAQWLALPQVPDIILGKK